MSKPLVVGIGEILWDLLPSGKQLGGAVANFAYHAQALGARGVVASCIGDDPPGAEIRQRLEKLGMGCDFLAVDPGHPTGTVEVQVDAKGVPTFIIHQNVAWDFIPATAGLLRLASRADCVCFGSLAQRSERSRQTIRAFLSATQRECLRIFDINLRQHYFDLDVVHQSLGSASVLKLNDQELPVLCGLLHIDGNERDAMGAIFHRYPLSMIALTCGEGGSRLYTPDGVHTHPGYPATVVDTVGAGDAFTAALAIGLLRHEPPDRINDAANRLASYVCSQAGATPAIPADLRIFI